MTSFSHIKNTLEIKNKLEKLLRSNLGGLKMNKQKNNFLTPNQVTYLLLSYVIGTGFLKLPNELIKIARQDAWISAIIALIYPIYVVLLSSYIINKHPKENILSLSKKYLGNLFGNILNFIFMIEFFIIAAAIISDFVFLSTTYVVTFLSPMKIIIITTSLAAYAAYKGLKVLSKISELIFYIFVPVMLLSLSTIKYGTILNIQPVFGTNLLNILKASKTTAYSYYGWEALLLFYPYVQETKAIKKSALKAVTICGVVYVWAIFSTTYYLGVNIAPKNYWSFTTVFESINIPVINSFRYVFMLVWFLITFRIAANYYFASALSLNDFIKIDMKKSFILIYPIVFYLSFKFSNRIFREKIVNFATPSFIIFNLIFITLIASLISIRHKGKSISD